MGMFDYQALAIPFYSTFDYLFWSVVPVPYVNICVQPENIMNFVTMFRCKFYQENKKFSEKFASYKITPNLFKVQMLFSRLNSICT